MKDGPIALTSEFLAELLDSAPSILAFMDRQLVIRYANRAYKEATGLSVHGNGGEFCYSAWRNEKACEDCPVLLAMETGKVCEAEIAVPSRELRRQLQRPWLAVAVPVRDQNGEVIGALESIVDLSEREEAIQRLRESEAKLVEAQYLARTGDFTWDIRSGEVTWSAGMHRLLGYALDEKIDYDRVNAEIHHPEDLARVTQWLREAIAAGECEVPSNEYRLLRKDHSVVHVHTEAKIELEDGTPRRLFGTCMDITERVKFEEELTNSRSRLEFALEAARLGTWDWDLVTNELIFEERVARVLGAQLASLPGDRDAWTAAIHKEDAATVRWAQNLHLAGTEDEYEAQYRIKTGDGSWRWVLDRGRVTKRNPDGRPLMMSGTIQDVTDQAQRMEELQRFKSMLDTAGEAIYLIDIKGDGRFADCNETGLRRLGYTRRELLALKLHDVELELDAENDREWQARLEALALSPEGKTFRGRHRRKDGTVFPVEVTGSMMQAPDGDYLLAFVRDVTEQRQSEDELRKIERQLDQAKRLESVGQLAGGIAHDFNNMLSVIIGHAELLQERLPQDVATQADVGEILGAAQRSADLAHQLLAYARRQTIAPRVLDLKVVIEHSLKLLRRLIGENLELVWSPDPSIDCIVRVDPAQVDQVLTNLCINARQAIGETGCIRIEVDAVDLSSLECRTHPDCRPGSYVRLRVSDDGSGMSEETRGHAFDPFFTTKDTDQGTGLGLATVYGIAKQNGGFVEIESELGKGTTVSVYFPTADMEETVVPEPVTRAAALEGTETLLVVEDEEAILDVVQSSLEKLGYTVRTATNPADAIRLAGSIGEELPLLVTDVVLPGMNGRELVRRLEAVAPGIQVIYMSGYTADVIAHRGILRSGVNFLQKPFSGSSLAHKVREVLDAGR